MSDREQCVRLMGEHYIIIGFGARLARRGWVLLIQRGSSILNGIESTENMGEGGVKRDIERLIEMHREEEGRHLKTVFTHGDISVFNILVKGGKSCGKVVGLIDFEMVGFYPEYWEYTTAMNSNYIKGWRIYVQQHTPRMGNDAKHDTYTKMCRTSIYLPNP
jgi:hypothetical protein